MSGDGEPDRAPGRDRGERGGRDRGGIALEAAVLVPALLLFLLFVLAAGRVQSSRGVVDEAARSAARAASLSRTLDGAQRAAEAAVRQTLKSEGVSCEGPVTVPPIDAAHFAPPVGEMGWVTVRLECRVPLHDLVFAGLPGSVPVTARFTSVVDSYRQR